MLQCGLSGRTKHHVKHFRRIYQMFEQLKELLVSELLIDPADITPEAELSSDLGISSVDLADLVCHCEEKFNIEIDDSDMGRFITIKDVVDYLESHRS